MDMWLEKVDEKIKENQLDVYMNEVYVDDNDLLLEALEEGTRWNGKRWK